MATKKLKDSFHKDVIKVIGNYKETNENIIKRDWLSSPDYTKLKQTEIYRGVVAFLLACKMNSGSAGNISLYTLIEKYLLNKEVRDEINKIIHPERYKR